MENINILKIFLKGLLLSIVYFEITRANDTTFYNVSLFTIFFIAMSLGAHMVDLDTTVVTTAFITKAVFTLVDERIKKKHDQN